MATRTNALDKIEELQRQIETLKQEAVDELRQKLTEARRVVAELENELADLTGRAPAEGRVRRVRRPSIGDDELKGHLLKAMYAKQLADKIDQDALRIRKFIKDNPKVLKRQGSGPGTKFFLP